MYKSLILIFGLFLTADTFSQKGIEWELQSSLDSLYHSNLEAIGIMVHVEAPDISLSWSGAAGYSDKNEKTPLHPNQPILIASSIKTYVAASILRLIEEGQLSLDMPIANLVKKKTRSLFEKDKYVFSEITVKHLLSHTSGIWNYANQEYIEQKKNNPNYRWSRNEQLQLTTIKGDPIGLPGAQFNYSDANYLLLTEIIENKTDLPFYEAMRKLLRYDELGINNTWFPTLEEKPNGTKPLAHQYWGSYNWDSYNLDISWDLYGGGGIACPTKDLALFIQNYFNGNIVKNDSIQNLIFTEIRTKETELHPYYLGLSQDNYHGMNAFGHGGFWSTVMMYFPKINTSISICILDRDKRALRRDVLDKVSKIILNHSSKQLNKNKHIKTYLNGLSDFSGTVLVAHKDQIIEQRAYGLSSVEHNVENNINTKFNLASISKLITATGILQLVEQNKLNLNDKVGMHLPDYPNATVRDSVTIHHLLSHTSGIPPFYNDIFLNSDKLQYNTVSNFLPLFQEDTLSFNPGKKYQYSGSNFVLLGRIIEEVSSMNYYDYIDSLIFKKVGMTNSLAIPTDSIVTNKANGYTCLWGDQKYFSRNDYYISKASPAGFHYSTANDLYLFSKAFRSGKLINTNSLKLMTSPKTRGYNTHIGYGIDIDNRYEEQIIGHSGGWFGIRTELMDFITSEYTIIVLSNKDDDGRSGASKVIDDIKKIIAGEKI